MTWRHKWVRGRVWHPSCIPHLYTTFMHMCDVTHSCTCQRLVHMHDATHWICSTHKKTDRIQSHVLQNAVSIHTWHARIPRLCGVFIYIYTTLFCWTLCHCTFFIFLVPHPSANWCIYTQHRTGWIEPDGDESRRLASISLNFDIYVAVCCSVLQCVAVCCNMLRKTTCLHFFEFRYICCSVVQFVAVCCSVLQYAAQGNLPPFLRMSIYMLGCVAFCCIVLQCVAVCCNVLRKATCLHFFEFRYIC